jgi:hypothetical protein
MLERYAELKQQQATIAAELAEIETALAEQAKSGPVAAGGWIARWKPGRKSTNHEAAAAAQLPPEIYGALYNKHTTATVKTPLIVHPLESLIEMFGDDAVSTSTAWAKVTKDGKCKLDRYTTEGDRVFVVEEVKP